jgi:hypothetical protein
MSNAVAKSNLTLLIIIGMALRIVIGFLIQYLYDESGDLVIALLGIEF